MIEILLTLAVAGVVVWLLTLIPKPPIFNQIIIGVAVIFVILWLLRVMPLGRLP